jgi:hypothetical protein
VVAVVLLSLLLLRLHCLEGKLHSRGRQSKGQGSMPDVSDTAASHGVV